MSVIMCLKSPKEPIHLIINDIYMRKDDAVLFVLLLPLFSSSTSSPLCVCVIFHLHFPKCELYLNHMLNVNLILYNFTFTALSV